MEFTAYIAERIKTAIYEPEGGKQEVFLIIETKDRIPTVAQLSESDVDILIQELQNRRRELRSKSLLGWFRCRWQAALRKYKEGV